MPPILVIDLEATCANDDSISAEEMEIIEIGACWTNDNGEILGRFQHFVRPLHRPTLTGFCMSLTGISQRDVDEAPLFPVAAKALREFAATNYCEGAVWMSWGAYDLKQITRDALRHGIDSPILMPHENAKRRFAKVQRIGKEVGMARACSMAGKTLQGVHHRGLDDAVNIASLMPWVLGLRQLPTRKAE
ncbi:3'-5' exonuclease [Herbaspirillum huttiense F1]|uniref:3'-5' exonuclease n=1 Tax=Herbaspirillum huttiense TaxID=863372 RepID=UPI0028885697|nr:3'-5' exonuclease [Herbaspirillum huttiense]MDT0359327.1 3'-5' exonuclease [Herbaspirillum huttiense F1]